MIRIIAAINNKNVIGANNKLIWRQKHDMVRFKQLTSGTPCIMGRKTYQSIGKLLPGRKNCIISRNQDIINDHTLYQDGSKVYQDIHIAIQENPDCFIIGGGEIYRQTIDIADEIYLTIIDSDQDGDTYFPEIPDNFTKVEEESHEKDPINEYNYKFIKYVRNK